MSEEQCACGSGNNYQQCCGQYVETEALAPTPEALMRSRYAAFTRGNIDYVQRTMSGPALEQFDLADAHAWANEAIWQKLEVLGSNLDPDNPDHGYVEFKAHYNVGGKDYVLHENSEFVRINGAWSYINGESPNQTVTSNKIGRNDPCPCGSGKKHKKCCGQT